MFRIFDAPTPTNSKACVSDCYSNTLGSAFHRPQPSSPAACSCFSPPPEPVGSPRSLPERQHYLPLPLTARVRVLIPVVTHQGSAETSCLSMLKGRAPHQTKNECLARAYVCFARTELFVCKAPRTSAHANAHSRTNKCCKCPMFLAAYFRLPSICSIDTSRALGVSGCIRRVATVFPFG